MLHHVTKIKTRYLVGYTIGILLLVIVVISAGVLSFELGSGRANITNYPDALWWSFSTITTIGYGDHYPISLGGRLLSVLLMFAGISLFVTFTGLISSSIMRIQSTSIQRREQEILQRIDQLEQSIEKMESLVKKVEKEITH